MDFSLVSAQATIFPQKMNQMVSVDTSRFHTNVHSVKSQRLHCGDDLIGQQPGSSSVVFDGESTVFAAVRGHEVCGVTTAPHINANIKLVHEYHLPRDGFSGQQALRYP